MISDQLKNRPLLDQAALAVAQPPAITPTTVDFRNTKVFPPQRQLKGAEPIPAWMAQPVKRDYLQREAANQSLGIAGEEFVLEFERWRLDVMGYPKLASQVEHVSKTRGDGLGYDIRSFESDGKERFIEVKTTSFGKETPFFVTQNELKFSGFAAQQFYLYRLFEFRKQPRLFDLAGEISNHCLLDPVTYRASFS